MKVKRPSLFTLATQLTPGSPLRTALIRAALAMACLTMFVSASSAQDVSGIGKTPYMVLWAGQAADTATTLDFLSRGYHESVGGPIGGALSNSPTRLVVMKTGVVVAQTLIMRKLEQIGRKRHSKALIWTGRIIGYGSGAVGVWAAHHNLIHTR